MSRDEIKATAERISGAVPGSQAFLGSLQDATTIHWRKLTEVQQDAYEDMARKWSKTAPPPHIQARYALAIGCTRF
jgi:hypothetical protein